MSDDVNMCEHEAASRLIGLASLLMMSTCPHVSADPATRDRVRTELLSALEHAEAVLRWLR